MDINGSDTDRLRFCSKVADLVKAHSTIVEWASAVHDDGSISWRLETAFEKHRTEEKLRRQISEMASEMNIPFEDNSDLQSPVPGL